MAQQFGEVAIPGGQVFWAYVAWAAKRGHQIFRVLLFSVASHCVSHIPTKHKKIRERVLALQTCEKQGYLLTKRMIQMRGSTLQAFLTGYDTDWQGDCSAEQNNKAANDTIGGDKLRWEATKQETNHWNALSPSYYHRGNSSLIEQKQLVDDLSLVKYLDCLSLSPRSFDRIRMLYLEISDAR